MFEYVCINPYILIHIFGYRMINLNLYIPIIRHESSKDIIVCYGCPHTKWAYSSWQFGHYTFRAIVGFHAIYQYAFPHLYSLEVCSRNCLVLTDKDEAEYRSFEAVIEITSDFKQSTVMLCTFHGVWMAFKKDLLTLLDECDCEKVYGTSVCSCIISYIRTHYI